MIVGGVDLSTLPDQFKGFDMGRTLILDGDGPCYVASATAKRLDTALRNFQQAILTQMFLTKSQRCNIHLTANTSHKAGRFNVIAAKPYQGNRNGKAKPPLLEPLRQAVAQRENWLENYHVTMHHVLEADDGMMHDAYELGEDGLIWSDDKDLRMTPYPYWCREKGVILPSQQVGWLSPKFTPSGAMKLIGQGPLFFWAQMLMGDTADHIQGIKKLNGRLCGPAATYEALREFEGKPIEHAANFVINAYKEIDQNPLPEATLLWLLRWKDDSALKYIESLALTEENRRYINECNTRVWYSTGEIAAHDDAQLGSTTPEG